MTLKHLEIAALRRAIETRRAALVAEIRQDVARIEDDRFVDVAGEVRDAGDESIAELIADIEIADLRRDAAELRDLDAALVRLTGGQYGTCSDCGEGIPLLRLQAQPAAARCIGCQEFFEKTHAQPGRARL